MANWITPLSWSHGETFDTEKFNQTMREYLMSEPKIEPQEAKQIFEVFSLRQMFINAELQKRIDKHIRDYFNRNAMP